MSTKEALKNYFDTKSKLLKMFNLNLSYIFDEGGIDEIVIINTTDYYWDVGEKFFYWSTHKEDFNSNFETLRYVTNEINPYHYDEIYKNDTHTLIILRYKKIFIFDNNKKLKLRGLF